MRIFFLHHMYASQKTRFDTVLETIELLSNAEFVETLTAHRQGKLRFKTF